MANNQQTTSDSKPGQAETAAETAKGFSNAQLAKLAAGTKVRVLQTGKDGKPVLDDSGNKTVIVRDVTAADIFSHRIDGDEIVIVTVDGQKIRAAA